MILHNIKKMKDQKGFTIVELLIVIVIIGILAAITIIAYNGITQRANTASAKSAANSAIAKMEAYNADANNNAGGYPQTTSAMTGAAATTTYALNGVTFTTTQFTTTAPATPSTLNFYTCTTGAQVGYYDYTAKAEVLMGTGGAATCTYKAAS